MKISDKERLNWMMWRHDPDIDGLKIGYWGTHKDYEKQYRLAIDAAIRAEKKRGKK